MIKQNVYLNHILPFSNKQPMICPYCQKTANFDKGLWRCNPCNALAKANKETKQPIGTMANQLLWNARKNTHKSFGASMQFYIDNGLSKNQSRKKVISEIVEKIGIPASQFNIECFDEHLCNVVNKILIQLKTNLTPICPYCLKHSIYIEVKRIYRCDPCDAQVGIHKHNNKPLGTLANAELREARKNAHAHFDPLWAYKMKRDSLSTSQARKSAYRWLASKMGIDVDKCHIGEFNIEQCNQVINHCSPYITNATNMLSHLNQYHPNTFPPAPSD